MTKNENYDELVKQARELAGAKSDMTSMKLAELAEVVEQLQKERDEFLDKESDDLGGDGLIRLFRARDKLARAEQQIADLRKLRTWIYCDMECKQNGTSDHYPDCAITQADELLRCDEEAAKIN